MKDVLKALDKMRENKNKSTKNLEEYIILALMVPPLRNDLMEIEVVTRKCDLKNKNAVYIPRKKNAVGILRISEHKASDRSGDGPIERHLDSELTNDIKEFLKRSHHASNILFVDREGKPFTTSSFTHKLQRLFKKILGVPFSSCVLRKLFWTDKREEIEPILDEAHKMGHSIGTALQTYMGKV